MRIAEIMTRSVQCVQPQSTLEEAARLMADHDIGALPVERDGEPVGILTDRDLAVRGVAQHYDSALTPVSVGSGKDVELDLIARCYGGDMSMRKGHAGMPRFARCSGRLNCHRGFSASQWRRARDARGAVGHRPLRCRGRGWPAHVR